MKYILSLFGIVLLCAYCQGQVNSLKRATDHYVDNEGVKIHYVSKGQGKVILFVHGFPDFWYTWRDQMEALSLNYKTVSVDLRGYNLSDGPDGVENYSFQKLVSDLRAVILDIGENSVFLVAHDWGAAISWRLAATYPELIEKLIILSVPHPSAGVKAPIDTTKSTYADYFVSDEFSQQLTSSWFSGWVKDVEAKKYYVQAFNRSNKEAMINYYRANYPTQENLKNSTFRKRNTNLPNLTMPVLVVHGKQDPFLPIDGHNNTWNFVDNALSIEIFENAGHFVQQDESDRLTKLIKQFLER